MPRFSHDGEWVEGPHVAMAANQIVVDGSLVESMAMVTAILKRKRELWQSFNPTHEHPGAVHIEADRNLAFARIKEVMHAAAAAGYDDIGFIGVHIPR